MILTYLSSDLADILDQLPQHLARKGIKSHVDAKYMRRNRTQIDHL